MSTRPFHIGLDFDNTIVSYDRLFVKLAFERGLFPKEVPPHKTAVRDYLRKIGKEDQWTELQGFVYGDRILEATPFDGAIDFIKRLLREKVQVSVVSHKTLYPFMGPRTNLHDAAKGWLAYQGLDHLPAFFELTREAKLKRIKDLGCTVFVDDLVEVLTEPTFPQNIRRILFDPNGAHAKSPDFPSISTWAELDRFLEK